MKSNQKIKKGLKYHLLKLAPYGKLIKIKLRNGIIYTLRARTMDKSILKEIWIDNIYDRFGINIEEGDTVIDIGAHVGIFSIYAAKRSKTGNVYAFEPYSENYKLLQTHKKINDANNLFAYNLAVSGAKGKRTLNLSSTDNNTGGHSMFLKSDSTEKVEVETIMLGKFIEQEGIHKIDFLKMDCEGAEFEILLHHQYILARVRKIILECHPFGNNTSTTMINLLTSNGFKVFQEENITDHNTPQMIYGIKNDE